MIIVKLHGGIGNQMFQYATAKRLAIHNKTELKLDISHYNNLHLPNNLPYRSFDLSIFNLEPIIANEQEVNQFKNNTRSFIKKIKNKIFPHKYILEPHYHFYPPLLHLKGNIYIDGYWQSEKYFWDIEKNIREDFEIKTTLNDEGIDLFNKIKNGNSVCLNIRRQEFASNAHIDNFVGLSYFENAIELISNKIEKPHFYIFSDELSWCKKNIKTVHAHTFVEDRFYGKKFNDCLFLMKSCKHFIIPNSTFGWWAAWLNNSENKIVIVPKNWFKNMNNNDIDLIPKNWIKT